jgi:hypothetical protein
MRFGDAIDEFIDDIRLQGRMNSDSTERSYRGTLYKHADDVDNRDPRKVGREDVKRTLARWKHPNTRATCRAALVSFYRWMVEEGMRAANPAEQTRRPRRRPATPYRLSREEVHRLLEAPAGVVNVGSSTSAYTPVCGAASYLAYRVATSSGSARSGFRRTSLRTARNAGCRYRRRCTQSPKKSGPPWS